MAKKAAKKPAAKKTPPKKSPNKATAAKSASAEKEKGAPDKAAPAKAAEAKPAASNDTIGYAAGDVWGALHGKGWQTLAAIKKSSGCGPDLTLLAIGWLAREGKLDFTTSGRTVKVTLRG